MKKSRTSLFLMELVISILLFSVTSAVCTSLFVNTHLKAREAKNLQIALNQTQNLTALIYAEDLSSPEEYCQFIQHYYPELSISTKSTAEQISSILYLTEDGLPSREESAATLQLLMKIHMQEDMMICDFQVYDVGLEQNENVTSTVIYQINCQKYLPHFRSKEAVKEVQND